MNIQIIAIVVCSISMCVAAVAGNTALTIMNGVLILANLIMFIDLRRD